MVSVFENDDVLALGVCARESECELVGFTAGIDEETHA